MKALVTVVLAIWLIFGNVMPLAAQYFGRNKVQYESFNFHVLTTEHFDIYYYQEEEAAVRLAARMAERWHARLTRVLQHELSGRQPIILYAAHPHFEQTNILGEIGEGTGGVTESRHRRVILPFAGGLAETDHVLGHELVHAFQYDMLSAQALQALPLWFIEGMAEYLSLGPVDPNTAMWVRDAASRDEMPTVAKLNDPDFFPYRYGHAFWAYVAGRWGDRVVGDLLRSTDGDGNVKRAIATTLGIDGVQLSAEWHEATKRAFAAVFETARRPNVFGRPLITRDQNGGDLNVTPSISPDGTHVVFLSSKSLFSIDMYQADVASGRIERRLVKTTTDPHFDSLQFIASAGDWAPDNRRFVFAALRSGTPVLVIVDTRTGDRQAEHEFRDLGEIYNPAWSPDGKEVAFSALKGGVLDLFVFSLESGAVRQLTNDPFADLDPEWSRDGRELVWVTDRFSSNLDTLSFGNYRIGVMSADGTEPRAFAGFETGRNSNPEFAADESLYFLATPDGIPNVYRLTDHGRGGAAERLTNVISGVAGITPLTPALSVAAAGDAVVFTVFEHNGYNIYAMDGSRPATPASLAESGRNNAILPPGDRRPGSVTQLLENGATGLPAARRYDSTVYKSKLMLDAISQPTIGVGADQFGAYAAGGVAFVFNDFLNDHTFAATIQSTSRIQETGAQAVYLNRKSRWGWGVVGEHLPYVSGSYGQGLTSINGQPAIVQETVRVTQINSGVSAIAQYPFSRVHRLEFSGGVRRIGFDAESQADYFSPTTGALFERQKQDLPHPDAINLAESAAALVYDTSIFGATSPLVGRRYRLEYTQLAGTLNYGGLLADFRQYVMPARPFTLAFRGLHYGRYGSGSEDPRLTPLFLGYQGLVRGYDFGSFDANECESLNVNVCPAFDRLNGSRVAVANAELRFPLLGLFSRSRFYGAFPIEAALFYDAGLAWTSQIKPAFAGGTREWARSAGTAFRVNVFGFAVAEVDIVRPFDRSRKGWTWQIGLTPGF